MTSFGDFGDFGNFGDFDFGGFDMLPGGGGMEETRYMRPRTATYNEATFVAYDNAVKLARDLRITEGMRADVFLSGNFIFGDFIEAFLTTHMARAERMTISTLSLGQDNVDSLQTLMEKGYLGELRLIVSAYFYSHERHSLVPYIYEHLDIEDRFQFAVAGCHTKTVHFETQGGKKIVIHGSANLRSSGNIEMMTIEENPALYDFFDECFTPLIEKYATIRRPVRRRDAWSALTGDS